MVVYPLVENSKTFASKISKTSVLGPMIRNPLIVTLILTIILIILIIYVKNRTKLIFYIALVTGATMFLHYYALNKELTSRYQGGRDVEIARAINNVSSINGYENKVIPNYIDGGEKHESIDNQDERIPLSEKKDNIGNSIDEIKLDFLS